MRLIWPQRCQNNTAILFHVVLTVAHSLLGSILARITSQANHYVILTSSKMFFAKCYSFCKFNIKRLVFTSGKATLIFTLVSLLLALLLSSDRQYGLFPGVDVWDGENGHFMSVSLTALRKWTSVWLKSSKAQNNLIQVKLFDGQASGLNV